MERWDLSETEGEEDLRWVCRIEDKTEQIVLEAVQLTRGEWQLRVRAVREVHGGILGSGALYSVTENSGT